jgi:hypothetical protein
LKKGPHLVGKAIDRCRLASSSAARCRSIEAEQQPGLEPHAEVVSSVGNSVIVRLHWRFTGIPADNALYQVLSVRNDKVREMVDCRTIADATKVAKRLAARS